MLTPTSIFTIPIVIFIAIGSVLLISKFGGKAAGKKIRYLHGIDDDEE
ncbi:MAG: hypothetical protein NC313_09050 [Butyrivibrio sp.]|nr:hypothetical protein [Butyrivibrio sp.]